MEIPVPRALGRSPVPFESYRGILALVNDVTDVAIGSAKSLEYRIFVS